MRTLLLRFSLIVFGLLIGLLFAELSLRIFAAAHIISIDKKMSFANDPFVYSSTLKYRIKPYFTRNCTAPGNPSAICYANYEGFRDVDHPVQKPENTFRVLLLGDSLTYGPGVNYDSTYPAILENLLKKNNKSNKKIEVIKMGMIFYGPEQYYNVYQQYGKKYHPDLIILSYHLLTDPYDAYEFDQNRRFYFYKSLPDILPYEVSQPLKEHSLLYRTLLSAYYSWANKQEVKVENILFHGKKNRYQYDTQLTTTPEMKTGWALSDKFVNAIVNETALQNAKIMIVAFPSPAQVIPDEWKRLQDTGYVSDKKLYDDSQTRKKLMELCSKYLWTCLDLQNELRKSPDTRKLFLVGDVHLTKEGNTMAAQSIFKFLQNKSLLE